jgi:hypothetical protein
MDPGTFALSPDATLLPPTAFLHSGNHGLANTLRPTPMAFIVLFHENQELCNLKGSKKKTKITVLQSKELLPRTLQDNFSHQVCFFHGHTNKKHNPVLIFSHRYISSISSSASFDQACLVELNESEVSDRKEEE